MLDDGCDHAAETVEVDAQPSADQEQLMRTLADSNPSRQKAMSTAVQILSPLVAEANEITARLVTDDVRFDLSRISHHADSGNNAASLAICMVHRPASPVNQEESNRDIARESAANSAIIANATKGVHAQALGIEGEMLRDGESRLLYIWSVEKFLGRLADMRRWPQDKDDSPMKLDEIQRRLRRNIKSSPWWEPSNGDINDVCLSIRDQVLMQLSTADVPDAELAAVACSSTEERGTTDVVCLSFADVDSQDVDEHALEDELRDQFRRRGVCDDTICVLAFRRTCDGVHVKTSGSESAIQKIKNQVSKGTIAVLGRVPQILEPQHFDFHFEAAPAGDTGSTDGACDSAQDSLKITLADLAIRSMGLSSQSDSHVDFTRPLDDYSADDLELFSTTLAQIAGVLQCSAPAPGSVAHGLTGALPGTHLSLSDSNLATSMSQLASQLSRAPEVPKASLSKTSLVVGHLPSISESDLCVAEVDSPCADCRTDVDVTQGTSSCAEVRRGDRVSQPIGIAPAEEKVRRQCMTPPTAEGGSEAPANAESLGIAPIVEYAEDQGGQQQSEASGRIRSGLLTAYPVAPAKATDCSATEIATASIVRLADLEKGDAFPFDIGRRLHYSPPVDGSANGSANGSASTSAGGQTHSQSESVSSSQAPFAAEDEGCQKVPKSSAIHSAALDEEAVDLSSSLISSTKQAVQDIVDASQLDESLSSSTQEKRAAQLMDRFEVIMAQIACHPGADMDTKLASKRHEQGPPSAVLPGGLPMTPRLTSDRQLVLSALSSPPAACRGQATMQSTAVSSTSRSSQGAWQSPMVRSRATMPASPSFHVARPVRTGHCVQFGLASSVPVPVVGLRPASRSRATLPANLSSVAPRWHPEPAASKKSKVEWV